MTNLSNFFPSETEYFYGYPAGEDSGFYNLVPPYVEELVSARPLVCAGDSMRVVVFANTVRDRCKRMFSALEVPSNLDNAIILPNEITASVTGKNRNDVVRSALRKQTQDNRLIMAQPYADKELAEKYQINADLSQWFNDKQNMAQYIPAQYLPRILAQVENGLAFTQMENRAPCVVKVTSSSSGDGVAICRTAEDFSAAQKNFSQVNSSIFVQELIQETDNIGIQFGIPADQKLPIEVIGQSNQLISESGSFEGGIVWKNKDVPAEVTRVLREIILPNVRKMGWYGVGGLDVLVKNKEEFYFIDPNFRMTAMTAPVYLSKNDTIKKNAVSMSGVLPEDLLTEIACNGSRRQLLSIVSLSEENEQLRFNGCLLFDQQETLRENAEALIQYGVRSSLLTSLLKRS